MSRGDALYQSYMNYPAHKGKCCKYRLYSLELKRGMLALLVLVLGAAADLVKLSEEDIRVLGDLDLVEIIENDIKDSGTADIVKLLQDTLDTTAASSVSKTNMKPMDKDGRYQHKKNSDDTEAHMPVVRDIMDGVQASKRAVIPFYIDTYYCWLHFYSKCPKDFSSSRRSLPQDEQSIQQDPKLSNHGIKEASSSSGNSKIRIL